MSLWDIVVRREHETLRCSLSLRGSEKMLPSEMQADKRGANYLRKVM